MPYPDCQRRFAYFIACIVRGYAYNRRMDIKQVLALLRRECDKAGGQAAWAKLHDVSPAYVSDVLTGRRAPGVGILVPLKVERVVGYRRFGNKGTPIFGRRK